MSLILPSVMIAGVLPLINTRLWNNGDWFAYTTSTLGVAIIGEILPQTIMSLFAMEIAVKMTWFVKILMGLMAIPALPLASLLHLARRWRKRRHPYKMDGLLEIDELTEFIGIHEEGAELGGTLENGTGKLLRMMMKQHKDLQHWKMVVVVHSGPQSSFTIFQQRIEAEAESSDLSSPTTESIRESSQETPRGLRRRTNQSSEAPATAPSEKVNPTSGSDPIRSGSTAMNVMDQPEARPLGINSRHRSSVLSNHRQHPLMFNQVDGPHISEVERLSLCHLADQFLRQKELSTTDHNIQNLLQSSSTPIAGQSAISPVPQPPHTSNGENLRNGLRSASTGMIPERLNPRKRKHAWF